MPDWKTETERRTGGRLAATADVVTAGDGGSDVYSLELRGWHGSAVEASRIVAGALCACMIGVRELVPSSVRIHVCADVVSPLPVLKAGMKVKGG